MAVGFRGTVLERAGQRRQQVGGFVEQRFGALHYELRGRDGRIVEDFGEKQRRRGQRRRYGVQGGVYWWGYGCCRHLVGWRSAGEVVLIWQIASSEI